jgi:hypothetical protein
MTATWGWTVQTIGFFPDLFSNIEFWRGVGRFVIDAVLVYALLIIVLAVSGHPPHAWPLSSLGRRGKRLPSPEEGSSDAEMAAPLAAHRRAASAEADKHREYLYQLATALKYQGSTVVLIIFAVILLGFQHVLASTEIATILSGIAGFVLGQAKNAAPPGGDDGGPAPAKPAANPPAQPGGNVPAQPGGAPSAQPR